MNDTRQGNDMGRLMGPMLGFAVGALVVGALGLLLAPASGEQTRKRIGDTAGRMGRDAGRTIDRVRESATDAVTGLGTDLKSAMDAGREAFLHDGEPRTSSRIAQHLTAQSPPTP